MGDAIDAVKCRKCRFKLFETNKLVDSHGNTLLPSKVPKDVCNDARAGETFTTSTVLYISEDSSSWDEWMISQIDNSEWIKGKLFCPKCNFRLGSFDFVGGALCGCGEKALPPVHITKSKVDYHVQEEHDEIEDLIQNRPPNPDFNYPLVTPETSASSLESENSAVNTLKEEVSDELTKGEENEGLYKRDHTLIKRKHKKKIKSKCDLPESDSASSLRTLLTCPVCLDIFFSPFSCKPCGHTFCETCLRRIALPRPTQTSCPLCRQLIYSCEIHKEYNKLIRDNFQSENNVRSCHEERALLQTSPLPWVPLYQFRNPEHERSFLETALTIPRNFVNSFWLTIPTIGLLFLLHCVGFVTFFISFFGFSYLGVLWVEWVVPIWKNKIFFGTSIKTEEEKDTYDLVKDSVFSTSCALFFSFIVTIIVWKKVKSLIARLVGQ